MTTWGDRPVPTKSLFALPFAHGHPVAATRLVGNEGGVVGIVTQLAPQVLDDGAHRSGAAGVRGPQTRCRSSAWVITRPALTDNSRIVRYSISVCYKGRPAPFPTAGWQHLQRRTPCNKTDNTNRRRTIRTLGG